MCRRDIGMTMRYLNEAMTAKRPMKFWLGLAQMYGEAAKIEKDCGSMQTAWTVIVDYMVA